jgi:hypothetical protein
MYSNYGSIMNTLARLLAPFFQESMSPVGFPCAGARWARTEPSVRDAMRGSVTAGWEPHVWLRRRFVALCLFRSFGDTTETRDGDEVGFLMSEFAFCSCGNGSGHSTGYSHPHSSDR